jgi:hypothetical protein
MVRSPLDFGARPLAPGAAPAPTRTRCASSIASCGRRGRRRSRRPRLSSSSAILVTRRLGGAGMDPDAVGFRWFWPSILRYRRPLAHVLVASLSRSPRRPFEAGRCGRQDVFPLPLYGRKSSAPRLRQEGRLRAVRRSVAPDRLPHSNLFPAEARPRRRKGSDGASSTVRRRALASRAP